MIGLKKDVISNGLYRVHEKNRIQTYSDVRGLHNRKGILKEGLGYRSFRKGTCVTV
jgi:hypothetical protein